ncbi:MAG: class I SAM-dependent methyltransferase [Campylobacterota bacterium]
MPRVDNNRFYAASLKKYGVSARGVQWRSEENQLIRFEQIAALILPAPGAVRIADAGCGFGDFYRFLFPVLGEKLHYIGIDSHEEMVRIARKRALGELLWRDVLRDPLPPADYYVCSGALNILTPYEAQRFIRRCYESSGKGFVFNFLEGAEPSNTYNYMSAANIERMARELNARCVLRRGYLQGDCTAAFYKPHDATRLQQ